MADCGGERQIAVENSRLRWNLWQIVVEIGGHVQGVTGVSRDSLGQPKDFYATLLLSLYASL